MRLLQAPQYGAARPQPRRPRRLLLPRLAAAPLCRQQAAQGQDYSLQGRKEVTTGQVRSRALLMHLFVCFCHVGSP
jgi:hypothetical protein